MFVGIACRRPGFVPWHCSFPLECTGRYDSWALPDYETFSSPIPPTHPFFVCSGLGLECMHCMWELQIWFLPSPHYCWLVLKQNKRIFFFFYMPSYKLGQSLSFSNQGNNLRVQTPGSVACMLPLHSWRVQRQDVWCVCVADPAESLVQPPWILKLNYQACWIPLGRHLQKQKKIEQNLFHHHPLKTTVLKNSSQ